MTVSDTIAKRWIGTCSLAFAGLLVLASARADTKAAQAHRAKTQPNPVIAISIAPSSLVLTGPYATARVLVDGKNRTGELRDVSAQVTFSTADRKFATVDESGLVVPRADGRTTIMARLGRLMTSIPVEVRGIAVAAPPRFASAGV